MLINDLISQLIWWFMFFGLGLIFLPLTYLLFKSFFDVGYIFSKTLSLILTGYFIWIIASIKIFPFNNLLIYGVIFLFFLINFFVFKKYKLLPVFKKHLKVFAIEELLFICGFFFWSFIKAHQPAIHGLEKFMDFGFINTILRSEYFPPKDMWFTPLSINYYYFGHFITALLIKISSIPSEVGYNLMLTSLFGLTLAASFSIGSNLYYFFSIHSKILNTKYKILSGLLGAFLVTLGGNLHTIYIFFQNYKMEEPIPFWQLPMILNLNGYWYPNATRFIPYTIHEFPIYSFVVSDLHGHVLNIPFVLLIIALLIKIFSSPIIHNTYYILLSLLVAVFLMTNFLDAPIYLLVIFLVFLAKKVNQEGRVTFPSILYTLYSILSITIGAVILSLPYWLTFKPFGSGIGVNCPPNFLIIIGKIGPFLFEADHCAGSPLWMLLILWGFPLFITILFIKFIFFNSDKKQIISPIDILATFLALSAFLLILIPEFFYVKDIYPAHWRANTVFKFGYQAFIILGITSGFMITRLLPIFKKYFLLSFITFLLFSLVAIYPSFAINSYFNGLENYVGLNGLNWLETSYPSDYQGILWLKNNVSGQPVILEGQGDSYSDFARVSANTGLPTVVGWTVHEWLWRGSYDEAGKRAGEVTELYESKNMERTKELIKKYNIQYIFVGTLEKQKYLQLDEDKFMQLGKIVFEKDQTRIYKID